MDSGIVLPLSMNNGFKTRESFDFEEFVEKDLTS